MLEHGEIAVCTPFLVEAGWLARSVEDDDGLLADLLELPYLTLNADVEAAALAAQSDLARRGHHRSASPSDLLIAACAHTNAAGVLHYDRGYDHLVELTGLHFESLASPARCRPPVTSGVPTGAGSHGQCFVSPVVWSAEARSSGGAMGPGCCPGVLRSLIRLDRDTTSMCSGRSLLPADSCWFASPAMRTSAVDLDVAAAEDTAR
jgi:predicted nucleic acid-binding protein